MDGVLGLLGITGLAVVSAVVPVVNAEALTVAGVVGVGRSGAHTALVVLAVAVGQTVGKLALLVAVRRGSARWVARLHRTRRLPRHRAVVERRGLPGRLVRASRVLLDSPRGTVPLVLLSASTGVPPLAVTTVALGVRTVPATTFTVCCLVGRSIRFGAVAVPVLLVA